MSLNTAALRATLEGLEAQIEAMGAAVEAALSMLPDDEGDEENEENEEIPAPFAPPPAASGPPPPPRPCEHKRTELAGGFGGLAQHAICSSCGERVPARR